MAYSDGSFPQRNPSSHRSPRRQLLRRRLRDQFLIITYTFLYRNCQVSMNAHYSFWKFWIRMLNLKSSLIKGGNRFKKGFFKMIFMIFFDNKEMNIIYLYFVNILYIYLRRNCEILKFFFWKTWKISAAAHQTSLFEVGTFVHSGSHRFYLNSIRFQI